jgi:RNA polymerase sigma factor (sigma-70 family)
MKSSIQSKASFMVSGGVNRLASVATLDANTILPGWLYRTARYAAAGALKQEARRQRHEQEARMESLADPTPADSNWEQLAPLLDDAMSRLRDKERDAIVLRYFQNRSLREVGTALGVEERAAQKRVTRSLEKLRAFFARRGVALTTAAIAGAVSAHAVQAAPVGLTVSATAAAMAQGAAVGSSTLMLIKGTLQLMAWTKLKTTAVVGAALLLTTGTTILGVKAIQAARPAVAPDIQGAWQGILEAGGTGVGKGETTRVRVVLKVSKTKGSYRATADVIDSGRKDIEVTRLSYDYPTVRIQVAGILSYEGKVNAEGTEISGPIILRRTTTPDSVPERLKDTEYAPREGSALQGYWKGTLDTGNVTLRLALDIAKQSGDVFTAHLASLDQYGNNDPIRANVVRCTPPTLRLEWKWTGGVFEGRLEQGRLSGTWRQGGASFPLAFERSQPE